MYWELLLLPFVACLVSALPHCWFGIHVLKREIIFIDLAIAQIAAMGAAIGLLAGFEPGSGVSLGISLVLTLITSIFFALFKSENNNIPIEAVIGISYAAASALSILVLDKSSEGSEHLKNFLVGNILTVELKEIGKITAIYLGIGFFHYLYHKHFTGRATANIKAVNFTFYLSFGLMVSFSVKTLGVLLVFSMLVIPAVAARMYAKKMGKMIAIAFVFSIISSFLGIAASFQWDFPMGASLVMVFTVVLVLFGGGKTLFGLKKRVDG